MFFRRCFVSGLRTLSSALARHLCQMQECICRKTSTGPTRACRGCIPTCNDRTLPASVCKRGMVTERAFNALPRRPRTFLVEGLCFAESAERKASFSPATSQIGHSTRTVVLQVASCRDAPVASPPPSDNTSLLRDSPAFGDDDESEGLVRLGVHSVPPVPTARQRRWPDDRHFCEHGWEIRPVIFPA
jgi:hypothetical protein